MNALSYISSHLASPIHYLKKKEPTIVPVEQEPTNNNEKIKSHSKATTNNDEDYSTPMADSSSSNTIEKSIAVYGSDRALRFSVLFWTFVLFFPKFLIVKPLLFLWFIVTFPLYLLERGMKHRTLLKNKLDENSQKNAERVPTTSPELTVIDETTEDDLAGGDEIYLQRDTIKGSLLKATSAKQLSSSKTVKSISSNNTSFSSKRMGKFLFPKKLIPRSIVQTNRRKKLVLDLDETLIHSMSRGTTHSNSSQGHIVEVKFSVSGVSTLYYVHKRPYCDFFLSKVSKWYDLIIFTASMKEYADPVIDWLEDSLPDKFSQRLYRTDCILRDGVGYIKDLSVISEASGMKNISALPPSLGEIIIIDNSPISYAMNVENAIQVEGWISDPTDNALLNLLPLLEALRFTTDVRNVLALKNGEKAFYTS